MTALSDRYSANELHAVCLRLMVLSAIVKERHASDWAIEVKEKRYALVNEALFQAAAKAPLRATRTTLVKDIKFELDEFLQLALGSAEPDGSS